MNCPFPPIVSNCGLSAKVSPGCMRCSGGLEQDASEKHQDGHQTWDSDVPYLSCVNARCFLSGHSQLYTDICWPWWPATSAAEHSESLANGCRRYIQLIISRKFATCLAKQLPLNKVGPKWSKVYQLAELWPALADQRRCLLLFSIVLRVATYQTYLNDLKHL